MQNKEFQDFVWQKGRELYRPMPWREDTRPYYVLVSELMLQQTQVDRVIPKFQQFTAVFPNEKVLASASLADVLKVWQGLGYNRRAKYLHEAAKQLEGRFPDTFEELVELPGVGKNTAGAILAYSFNQPLLFIETNIRTVYIHHFFADNFDIDDNQILEKLEQTLDQEQPREFYWALMDYGSSLKRQGVKNISQSKHYKKQSPLKGSVREIRGQMIKILSTEDLDMELLKTYVTHDHRFDQALQGLLKDKLVTSTNGRLHLTK